MSYKHTNKNDQKDISSLMAACIRNNYEEVVDLVEKLNVNTNYQRRNGSTALIYAIYEKNYKIVKYLCEKGADKELRDETGHTALMYAIYMCPDIALYLIINGSNVNIKNIKDETPMHFAAMSGNLLIIKLLHERGADINVYTNLSFTPLMMACGNKFFECVKYFIKNGADINVCDIEYDNLLHLSVFHNTYDILLYLLTNKNIRIINEKNNKYDTPLLDAIKQNKLQFAELLLKYGADTHTCDNEQNTPLLYAIKKNSVEATKLLLKYGANPNTYFPHYDYRSPLYYAVKNKNLEIRELLLKHKADDLMYVYIEIEKYKKFEKLLNKDTINEKNNHGSTLLFFAAQKNKLKFVKLLLENGADPNINNIKLMNESPLYHAVIHNNYDMIQILLEYNADYNNRLYGSSFQVYIGDMQDPQRYKDGYRLSESIMATAIRYLGERSDISQCLNKLNAILFYDYDN